MPDPIVVGIDPGLKGAIARIDSDGLSIEDMPTITADGKQVLYVTALADVVARMVERADLVVVEKQIAMPTDARSRVLKTGWGEGVLCARPAVSPTSAACRASGRRRSWVGRTRTRARIG